MMSVPAWVMEIDPETVPAIMVRLDPSNINKLHFIDDAEFVAMVTADTSEWYPVYDSSLDEEHGPLTGYEQFFFVAESLANDPYGVPETEFLQELAHRFSGFDFPRDRYARSTVGKTIWMPLWAFGTKTPTREKVEIQNSSTELKRKPWVL